MLLVVKKSALEEKHASVILKELLKTEDPIFLSALQDIVKNYYALQNTVVRLAEEGYIEVIETEYKGRSAKRIKLTEKGRAVAEKLKEAEKISKIPPEELEKYRRIHVLQHFNIYDDHITLTDISLEGVRYVNIFAKPKGDLLYFWCDVHDDNDCYHIGYLFVDEKLRNFIKEQLNKNGYKLAKKYEKYVEKYW